MVSAVVLAMALANVTGCSKGTEFVPPLCPAHLPRVVSVAVERLGARAYPETAGEPPCAGFRPSRGQIIGYLSRARTTDAQSADATLDRSPCHASGSVGFSDGSRGHWQIERLGVGTLLLRGRVLLLYCRECTASAPFAR